MLLDDEIVWTWLVLVLLSTVYLAWERRPRGVRLELIYDTMS